MGGRVWFTIGQGVLTEVYYPTIDRPQMRDLEFLFSDGNGLFLEEKRDLDYQIERILPSQGYRISRHDSEAVSYTHLDVYKRQLGVVYGAGYTAAHVTNIVLWGMVGTSVLACGLIALTAFRPRAKLLAAGIGVYAVLYAVGVLALPQLVQAFVVRPSELSRETPYLKDYIEFTRNAYKLNVIQETAYPALTDLTPEVIARNQDTIQNIRLWDSRPLLQTYQQTQAIRLYYQFYNVDTDRYHLADRCV